MLGLRDLVFLKDVLVLSVTAIGGPHSHIPMFIKRMVNYRRYLTEAEFVELNALCQILPGPTSTQTITALGYKMGGANLAYLTLLIWVLPSMIIMTAAGIMMTYWAEKNMEMPFLAILEPMAVGFVAYSTWVIGSKVITTKTATIVMIISAVIGYFLRFPWVAPILLVIGGLSTTFKFKRLPKEEVEPKINVKWANFIVFIAVFLVTFILGLIIVQPDISKGVQLFETFYRNGSLVFGGGQVLVSLLHTEYVDVKHYLTSQEFLTGYALVQAIPGPIFAFSSYIGAMSMKEFGISGQILGSILSTAGIFLPGTFLIFFIYRLWDELKKYRAIKASLEGINSVSAGLVLAVAFFLFDTISLNYLNGFVMLGTFIALMSEKISPTIIIIIGLSLGYFI
ncbi:MAG: chromate efflux transporter [Cytophagales bacterium]|nr:MAG: chromate efflux transporter [Cytophagales bacterium]